MTDEPTVKQLQERAAELEIDGRSSLSKDDLVAAIAAAEAAQAAEAEAAVPSPPETEAQASAAGLAASLEDVASEPTPPEIVGRPDLVEVAQQSAADRDARMNYIGDNPTQEED